MILAHLQLTQGVDLFYMQGSIVRKDVLYHGF
jgi:hypothetical protein